MEPPPVLLEGAETPKDLLAHMLACVHWKLAICGLMVRLSEFRPGLCAGDGCEYLPSVLSWGELPQAVREGVTHYAIVNPLPKVVDRDQASWRVLLIYRDISKAIQHMEKKGWVHCDPSRSNIMWVELGQYRVRGMLLHNDTAAARSSADDRGVTATPLYKAYRLVGENKHTTASDLETIFYSLLDVLSNGEALPWRDLVNEQYMASEKLLHMFTTQKWQDILSKCRADCRGVLTQLHDAIFIGGHLPSYMEQPVSAEVVVNILNEGYKHLRGQDTKQ